jgi:hypothetical protein
MPLFPLNMVAFPGQTLNLHIFEPRYKELTKDCVDGKMTFGIPSFVLNKIEYGTEMEIVEVAKTYEDGRMDIATRALSVIKVLEMDNPYGIKKYAGGEVEILKNVDNGDVLLQEELQESISELYQLVDIPGEQVITDFKVYDIAHKVGLSKEAEYFLLQLTEERKRQRYLLDHMKVILPKLRDIQTTKSRIQMNGHFRHYDPLDF